MVTSSPSPTPRSPTTTCWGSSTLGVDDEPARRYQRGSPARARVARRARPCERGGWRPVGSAGRAREVRGLRRPHPPPGRCSSLARRRRSTARRTLRPGCRARRQVRARRPGGPRRSRDRRWSDVRRPHRSGSAVLGPATCESGSASRGHLPSLGRRGRATELTGALHDHSGRTQGAPRSRHWSGTIRCGRCSTTCGRAAAVPAWVRDAGLALGTVGAGSELAVDAFLVADAGPFNSRTASLRSTSALPTC